MKKHIECWKDTASGDGPVHCVSVCDEDGDEIRCIGEYETEHEARAAAIAAAARRSCEVFFRAENGSLSPVG